jgi:hypothetical protein
MSLSLLLCLSVSWATCLSGYYLDSLITCLSFYRLSKPICLLTCPYLLISLTVYISVLNLSFCLYENLFAYLTVCLFACLSVNWSVLTSANLSSEQSVCLFVCQCASLLAYLLVCLSVYASICLSVVSVNLSVNQLIC